MTDSPETKISAATEADSPTQLPARSWGRVLWRVKSEVAHDHVSVVAAGVAFYGLMSIFPSLAALVALAGLILDPADLGSQLQRMTSVLPDSAASILQEQIVKVTAGGGTGTTLVAIFGLGVAVYGAMKGVMTLIEGLNIAYDRDEERGIVRLYLTAAAITLFLLLGFIVALALVIVLPAVVSMLSLGEWIDRIISLAIWPILALFMVLGLAVIYRFGPSRKEPQWRWVSPGAVVATCIWIAATVGFSFYARNFGSYTETYGALGGVVILLTWLWLSAFVVLAGAELNAEVERQAGKAPAKSRPQPRGMPSAKSQEPAALSASGGISASKPRETSQMGLALLIGGLAAWKIYRDRRGQKETP